MTQTYRTLNELGIPERLHFRESLHKAMQIACEPEYLSYWVAKELYPYCQGFRSFLDKELGSFEVEKGSTYEKNLDLIEQAAFTFWDQYAQKIKALADEILGKIDLTNFKDYDIQNVPEWSLPALINGDYENLTDDDIKALESWRDDMQERGFNPDVFDFIRQENGLIFIDIAQEPSFFCYPAFGLATACYTCLFTKF
jgi:hypothetical protein